jgi:adenylate kinase family enzyme
VRLLLLAPPGAGKGTQGERLAAWSGARHIAAGDLLRAEARADTPAGRADDVAGVIQHRLRVFAETTGPLVPYYTQRGILVAVNADQPPDAVTADIQARLSGLRLTPLGGHD